MISSWKKENNSDIAAKFVLFLISPFVSLLYSLRNLNKKSSFWVVFGFCVCFGLAFNVGLERFEGSGDGITYRVQFEQYRTVSTSEYLGDLKSYLEFDEGAKDFYADTVSFLVSRVTGNYHFLFMVYAIVFAFFQLKALRFFVSANAQNKPFSLYVLCLLALFTFNQIFNINGVRFWTAAWIAVYSVLQIFYNGNKRFLLLAAITPFVHGSFFLFLVTVVLALFSSKLKNVWMIVFVLSFAFSTIAVDVFNMALDYLPSFMANQASAYLDEWTISEYQNQQGTGLFAIGKAFTTLEKVYINLLVLLLAIKKKDDYNKGSNKLIVFILILASMANFTMLIPSVGARFIRILYPLIALLFVQYMPESKYKILVYCFPVIFVFSFYYLFMNYLNVVGLSFFISSPLLIFINSI